MKGVSYSFKIKGFKLCLILGYHRKDSYSKRGNANGIKVESVLWTF